MADPYDELPYLCSPIEHTAPERLALASVLHGGPRVALGGYRVLELGCGDGSNLLPMAYYRRQAHFVGIDGARTQVALAHERTAALGLENLRFIHADFEAADARLDGEFDFIILHGVFSWVPMAARDALLRLCARRLRSGGLLYLSYNAKPGWNIRGMVREMLLAQTSSIPGLAERARAARSVCHRLVEAMGGDEHAYRRLMIDELCLVRDGDLSYVAHEYLAPDNHAYWRSELTALLAEHDLSYVADADFDQPWARLDADFTAWLVDEDITGRGLEDTIDLLLYRQLCSPIFTRAPLERRPLDVAELSALTLASQLAPLDATAHAVPLTFGHPSGYEVEVRDEPVRDALLRLLPRWPRGLPVGELFGDVDQAREDLELLHRNGLVSLRCIEPEACGVSPDALHRLQSSWSRHRTTPYHGHATDAGG